MGKHVYTENERLWILWTSASTLWWWLRAVQVDDGDKRHLKLFHDVEKYVKFPLCIYNSGKSHFQKNLNKILVK